MSQFNKVIELILQTKDIVFDSKLRAQIHTKAPSDFVTAVDTRVSEFLKVELKKLYPEFGFISEEQDNDFSQILDNCWILDPIDGTTNLVFDYQLSSVSLALLKDGEIVFGVVYNPFNGELFHAEKGMGAFLGDRRLQVSSRKFSQSLIEFGAGYTRKNEADEAFAIAKAVYKECLDIRRVCSSALAICYIAAARLDGYFEKKLKIWDFAAALLVLQEAGGRLADWNGEKIRFVQETTMIATNRENYDSLLSKVMQHRIK